MNALTKKNVGLLGGSFNPPHFGHVHISTQALDLLNLDEIWWLISPQNPLKSPDQLQPTSTRMAQCTLLTADIPYIQIKTIEQDHHTHYSCDIIPIIQKSYSNCSFVWLMGADNLTHFHQWKHWKTILNIIPIAVMDREPYSHSAFASTTAISYQNARIYTPQQLKNASLPAWSYIRIPTCTISSTKIRNTTP